MRDVVFPCFPSCCFLQLARTQALRQKARENAKMNQQRKIAEHEAQKK
jgi:hypothetical protein